jgi:16S rRNA processing protein RimM
VSDRDTDALAVAEVVAPHGIRGWVRVRLHDPASTALRPGLVVTLRRPGAEDMSIKLLAVEPIPGKPACRVQLAGVADRDAAEALRGRQLWLARADLPPLAPGEFYLADLIGLPVERVRPDGRVQPLGTVVGLTSNGAQDLLEVEWQPAGRRSDTWLLPVVPHFIAELADRLRVDLPLGMLPDELDEPEDSPDAGEPRA